MAGEKDKLVGKAKVAAGKVREGIGDKTGDKEMSARGRDQQVEGKADQIVGGAKAKAKDLKDKIKGD